MKKILFVAIILLGIFLIYLSTLDKKVFYLSLGDELSVGYNEFNAKDYGYSDYIKNYLEENNLLEIYINSYFKENMRTTDLIRMINDNEKVLINDKPKTIKNSLIKADLVTLSIGTNDIISKISLYKNYNQKEMYEYLDSYLLDLEKLLDLLKQYCKEDIVFIGYYNLLNDNNVDSYFRYLNDKTKILTTKYEISYIDIYEIMKNTENKSNSFYPTKKGYINIGEKIKEVINQQIFN